MIFKFSCCIWNTRSTGKLHPGLIAKKTKFENRKIEDFLKVKLFLSYLYCLIKSYWFIRCNIDISDGEYEYSMDHFGRALCREFQHGKRSNYGKDYHSSYSKKGSFHSKKDATPPLAKALYKKLKKLNIKCELEYYDGYKHVDLAIPWARLYIEVDGYHHYFYERQLESDFWRDEFSGEDGFKTLRLNNEEVEEDVERVAKK